jgi:cold shock CspA family protein
MPYGTVTRLVPEHGFGFIVDDAGMDWFFVGSGVRDGAFDALWVDERVAFSSEWTSQGPRAVDIHHEQLD